MYTIKQDPVQPRQVVDFDNQLQQITMYSERRSYWIKITEDPVSDCCGQVDVSIFYVVSVTL